MYLKSSLEFMLAMSFLTNNLLPQIKIEPSQSNVELTAKNHCLIFVKEIQKLGDKEKGNIMVIQRFFDPDDQYR